MYYQGAIFECPQDVEEQDCEAICFVGIVVQFCRNIFEMDIFI